MHHRRSIPLATLLVPLLLLLATTTAACWTKPTLYWTNAGASAGSQSPAGSIERRDRSGERTVLVGDLRSPRALAIDTLSRKLFYTDPAKQGSDPQAQLTRAELDGTHPTAVFRTNDTFAIEGLAVNPMLGQLYFAQNGLASGPGEIWVANLAPPFDPKPFVVDELDDPRDVAVDPFTGRVYWTDSGRHSISSIAADGTDRREIVSGLDAPYGLALDAAARRLYWTDPGAHQIARCDLGRCVPKLLAEDLNHPLMLELDVSGEHLYWTDMQLGQILRVAIDGQSEPEVVISGLDHPAGLALLME